MLSCEATVTKIVLRPLVSLLTSLDTFSLLSCVQCPLPSGSQLLPLSLVLSLPPSLSLPLSPCLLLSCFSIIDEVIMIWSQEKCIPVTLNLPTQFATFFFGCCCRGWRYFIVGGQLASLCYFRWQMRAHQRNFVNLRTGLSASRLLSSLISNVSLLLSPLWDGKNGLNLVRLWATWLAPWGPVVRTPRSPLMDREAVLILVAERAA